MIDDVRRATSRPHGIQDGGGGSAGRPLHPEPPTRDDRPKRRLHAASPPAAHHPYPRRRAAAAHSGPGGLGLKRSYGADGRWRGPSLLCRPDEVLDGRAGRIVLTRADLIDADTGVVAGASRRCPQTRHRLVVLAVKPLNRRCRNATADGPRPPRRESRVIYDPQEVGPPHPRAALPPGAQKQRYPLVHHQRRRSQRAGTGATENVVVLAVDHVDVIDQYLRAGQGRLMKRGLAVAAMHPGGVGHRRPVRRGPLATPQHHRAAIDHQRRQWKRNQVTHTATLPTRHPISDHPFGKPSGRRRWPRGHRRKTTADAQSRLLTETAR